MDPLPAREQFVLDLRGIQPIGNARWQHIGLEHGCVVEHGQNGRPDAGRYAAQNIDARHALATIALEHDHDQRQRRPTLEQDACVGGIAGGMHHEMPVTIERVEQGSAQLTLRGNDQDARVARHIRGSNDRRAGADAGRARTGSSGAPARR